MHFLANTGCLTAAGHPRSVVRERELRRYARRNAHAAGEIPQQQFALRADLEALVSTFAIGHDRFFANAKIGSDAGGRNPVEDARADLHLSRREPLLRAPKNLLDLFEGRKDAGKAALCLNGKRVLSDH